MTDCPDGTLPDPMTGCQGDLLPGGSLTVPASCSAVALDACPTPTSTVFKPQTLLAGAPISVVPAAPTTWVTAVRGQGYDVGLTDGTVRIVGGGAPPQVVAGSHNRHCSNAMQPCGDGGPATKALLSRPAGLALGLDGSLYIADPTMHRIRRIDPSGTITTVAGTGQACSSASARCGDGGPATSASLSGPYGVWANPAGALFIADGVRGIREVLPNGNITTIGAGSVSGNVVSVVGDAGGNLYAATNNPDYIIQVDLSTGQVTTDVGTGSSGYNGGSTGNQGAFGALPGNQAQINNPEGLSVTLGGDVLFADSGNDLIRAYDPSTGNMTANLGGLVSANGNPQGGFNGDGQYADQTTFQNPAAVTATRGALIVVADTGNSRVRQFGPYPLPTQRGGGVGTPPPLPKPPNTPKAPNPHTTPNPSTSEPPAPATQQPLQGLAHHNPPQRDDHLHGQGARTGHGRRARHRPEEQSRPRGRPPAPRPAPVRLRPTPRHRPPRKDASPPPHAKRPWQAARPPPHLPHRAAPVGELHADWRQVSASTASTDYAFLDDAPIRAGLLTRRWPAGPLGPSRRRDRGRARRPFSGNSTTKLARRGSG